MVLQTEVSWKDKRTKIWVLDKIESDLTIRKSILERKLTYFGHIVRRNRGVEKQILQGAAEGRRGRGHPQISWTDDDGVYRPTSSAYDRGRWRTLVKTTAAQLCVNSPERERERERDIYITPIHTQKNLAIY